MLASYSKESRIQHFFPAVPGREIRLLLRLGLTLPLAEGIDRRRRIGTLIAAQQAINREKLDSWIILVGPEALDS
jgi:hypothetical protein